MTIISDEQFDALYTFRHALRSFMRWSEDRAAAAGLTGRQHQLLLAVRAHSADVGPSVGDVANFLLIKPHSAVELVNRVEAMGLVARVPDTSDQRVVRVTLTNAGIRVLDELTGAHLVELKRAAEELRASSEFVQQLAASFDGFKPA